MFQITAACFKICSNVIMITVSPVSTGATVKMTVEMIVMKSTVPHTMVSHTKLITVAHDTVLLVLLGLYLIGTVLKSLLALYLCCVCLFLFVVVCAVSSTFRFQVLKDYPLSALVKAIYSTSVCVLFFCLLKQLSALNIKHFMGLVRDLP